MLLDYFWGDLCVGKPNSYSGTAALLCFAFLSVCVCIALIASMATMLQKPFSLYIFCIGLAILADFLAAHFKWHCYLELPLFVFEPSTAKV